MRDGEVAGWETKPESIKMVLVEGRESRQTGVLVCMELEEVKELDEGSEVIAKKIKIEYHHIKLNVI